MKGEEILKMIEEENYSSEDLEGLDIKGFVEKLINNADMIAYYKQGECRGFAFYYSNTPELGYSYISLMIVSKKERRMGVGTLLMNYILSDCQNKGFNACRLEVSKKNTGAITLYEKIGFALIEERESKYLMEVAF